LSAEKATLLEARDIVKVYPDGTIALRGVSIKIFEGEVLGLLGENGAGKTTLVKILAGVLRPTSGKIFVRGREAKLKSSKQALDLGIGLVQQHFSLIDNMTVLENIILGREEASLLSPLSMSEHREKIEELAKKTGLKVPLDVEVGLLPVGLKQRVEILKTLYKGVDLLMLDEPTTFLTPIEVDELFSFLRNLASFGKSVVFISHKIKEVLKVTDRIVVMRGGRVVGELPTKEATPEILARMMVGDRMVPAYESGEAMKAEAIEKRGERPLLEVRNLRVLNDLGVEAVRGVSFELYPGEILGIAGVEGNGQDELVEAIVGIRRPLEGEIVIDGSKVERLNPIEAYSRGVSYIPGDRDRFGLVLQFEVRENAILSRQWERGFLNSFGINWASVSAYASRIIREFNVVTSSIRSITKTLSGGNRQRLLVGRELTKSSKVVIAVHPTRGLDIASTEYIQGLLMRARDEGRGVLLVSADLDEILKLSDRIAVMYEGKFLAIKPKSEFTIEEIGLLMGGVVKG